MGLDSLIVDANVLIDYAETEPQILALVTRFIGPVLIPRPLLHEVQQLSEKECRSLGLEVIDMHLELMVEASALGGALSFEDWLCLLNAKESAGICVTNDRRLRKECEASGVKVRWGLELMADLVRGRKLAPERALDVAWAIQASNPTHITPAIIERFERRLEADS